MLYIIKQRKLLAFYNLGHEDFPSHTQDLLSVSIYLVITNIISKNFSFNFEIDSTYLPQYLNHVPGSKLYNH